MKKCVPELRVCQLFARSNSVCVMEWPDTIISVRMMESFSSQRVLNQQDLQEIGEVIFSVL